MYLVIYVKNSQKFELIYKMRKADAKNYNMKFYNILRHVLLCIKTM